MNLDATEVQLDRMIGKTRELKGLLGECDVLQNGHEPPTPPEVTVSVVDEPVDRTLHGRVSKIGPLLERVLLKTQQPMTSLDLTDAIIGLGWTSESSDPRAVVRQYMTKRPRVYKKHGKGRWVKWNLR